MIPVTYIRENRGHEMSWSTYFLLLSVSILMFVCLVHTASAASAAPSSQITPEIRAEAKMFKMVPRLYILCSDNLYGVDSESQKKLRKRCQKVWDYQAQKIRDELARQEAEAATRAKAEAEEKAREEDARKRQECYDYFLQNPAIRERVSQSRMNPSIGAICSSSYMYGKDFNGNWKYR